MSWAYPAPVAAVLYVEDLRQEQAALEDGTARMDDAYWAREVRKPFTWRRFTAWWVARRWVVPRDVTKE